MFELGILNNMKLLLTSAGIKNKSIAQAVLDLVAIPANKVKIVFIPTAANVEEGDKGWLIDDLGHFQEQKYESIDIVDIAAVPEKVWRPRIEGANLICFGGGNEQYLARIIRESGLKELLPDLLKTRVYMGISAGSMVAGTFLPKNLLEVVYPENHFEEELEASLAYVNCNFIPHLNSPHFPNVRKETLESLKGLEATLYGLDDQSALKIVDDQIEIISEGETTSFSNRSSYVRLTETVKITSSFQNYTPTLEVEGTKVSAFPRFVARPVRPMRCT